MAGSGAPRRASMADVAREASVSTQTVSRTLRGSSEVRPATRLRVLEAVDRLGYRMNGAARTLSSGRSGMLGLVVLREGGYYSRSAVTIGVETAAAARGLKVNTTTVVSLDSDEVEAAVLTLAEQGVEGIVVAVPLLRLTRGISELALSIPVVTLDGPGGEERSAALLNVGTDQRSVGAMATSYLLGLGHRNVLHLSGPSGWAETMQRQEGWRQALDRGGIPAGSPIEGDWSAESGYRAGEMVAQMPNVTAVFAASDEMAFGLIRALLDNGRQVPRDVSVVGVDDIALAPFCCPPLTTVRQDLRAVGVTAVRALVAEAGLPQERHSRPDTPIRPTWDEPRLIVRGSAAPPSGSGISSETV